MDGATLTALLILHRGIISGDREKDREAERTERKEQREGGRRMEERNESAANGLTVRELGVGS